MASRDHDSDGDSLYYAPYTSMGEETASDPKVQLLNVATDTRTDEDEATDFGQKGGRGDMQALMGPAVPRLRSHSFKLKSRLKQVKAQFASEKSPVADAFIDSTKNKPKYMKDEHSNDLLV